MSALYPGHGRLSTNPVEDIDRAIEHAQMLLGGESNAKLEIFYEKKERGGQLDTTAGPLNG